MQFPEMEIFMISIGGGRPGVKLSVARMNLLSILLLPIVIAQGNPVINEGTTEADIAKLKDCTGLSVPLINRLLKPEACHGFTPGCLAQFELANLNWPCVHQISFSTKTHLHRKSFVELLNTEDPHAVHLLHFKLAGLLTKYGGEWRGLPPLFTAFCARDYRCVDEVMTAACRTDNWALLSGFMGGDNITHIHPVFFHDLPSDAFKMIPAEALGKITLDQFRMLEGHVLTNLTGDQARALPPAFFRHWADCHLLQYYNRETLNALSLEQLAQFGPDPTEVVRAKGHREGEKRHLERMETRSAIYEHPCYHLTPLLARFDRESVRRAIEQRCTPIWEAVGHRAIMVRRDLDYYVDDD
jgi:hypothetical protein